MQSGCRTDVGVHRNAIEKETSSKSWQECNNDIPRPRFAYFLAENSAGQALIRPGPKRSRLRFCFFNRTHFKTDGLARLQQGLTKSAALTPALLLRLGSCRCCRCASGGQGREVSRAGRTPRSGDRGGRYLLVARLGRRLRGRPVAANLRFGRAAQSRESRPARKDGRELLRRVPTHLE